eukprot:scaffold100981_cov31-Tisochrysis_lutea.AAC.4
MTTIGAKVYVHALNPRHRSTPWEENGLSVRPTPRGHKKETGHSFRNEEHKHTSFFLRKLDSSTLRGRTAYFLGSGSGASGSGGGGSMVLIVSDVWSTNVTAFGAYPETTYASYPTPSSREHRSWAQSKQSPACQPITASGDGTCDGREACEQWRSKADLLTGIQELQARPHC